MRGRWLRVAFAVLAIGCGGGDKSGGGSPSAEGVDATPVSPLGGSAGGVLPTGAPPTPSTPTPVDCSGRVDLLVKGVYPVPAPFSSFRVDIDDVAATALRSATSFPVESPASAMRELVRDGATTVGTIRIPDGFADLVRVRITISSVHVKGGTVDRDLEVKTAPLTFYVDRDAVAPGRCHAVLHLDLASSLQPDPVERLLFLPRYSLHY